MVLDIIEADAHGYGGTVRLELTYASSGSWKCALDLHANNLIGIHVDVSQQPRYDL